MSENHSNFNLRGEAGHGGGRCAPDGRGTLGIPWSLSLRHAHDMTLSPVAVAAYRMMRGVISRTLSQCVERLRFTRKRCAACTRCPRLASARPTRNDVPPRAVAQTLSTGDQSNDPGAFGNARAGNSRKFR